MRMRGGGCSGSRLLQPDSHPSAEHGKSSHRTFHTTNDQRWDEDGFYDGLGTPAEGGQYPVAWVKAGYVRRLARCKGVLARRQELPEGALHVGVPPDNVELFSVSSCWLSPAHSDPEGSKVAELAALLDREGADDHDLIFWDWCSMHQKDPALFALEASDAQRSGRVTGERQRTYEQDRVIMRAHTSHQHGPSAYMASRNAAETAAFGMALRMMTRMYAFSRMRVIVLPRTPPGMPTYIDRGWTTFEAIIASYCSRLVYSRGPGNEDVEKMMAEIIEPERVMRPELLLKKAKFTNDADASVVVEILAGTLGSMPAIPRDAIGFEQFCASARIAWLRVATVKAFAERPGPFPRRQELPAGGYVVGAPPSGSRKFVVSHGWESEVHPSPSGYKMQRLAEILVAAEASDDDCVFFDFCSNAQEAKMGRVYGADEPFVGAPPRSATAEAYFQHNGVAFISGRTHTEDAAFRYAMWDMGRLYAYQECEIIIIPDLLPLASFPAQSSPTSMASGHADAWGVENSTPYEFRGWCCSEFATALASSPDPRKRIKNYDDPSVQRVLKSRPWPTTVPEYAAMMKHTRRDDPEENAKLGLVFDPKLGVDFTAKGDRLVVKYNFFKMTFDPQAWAQSVTLRG